MKNRILGLVACLSLFGTVAVPAVTYAQYGGGGGPPVGLFGAFDNAGGPSGGTNGPPQGNTGNGQVLGASAYNFTKNFCVGTDDEDVTQLQLILIADGYLDIKVPTGYYGPLTKAAVVEYQKANDISPATGCVGPLTRAALNAGVTPTQGQENTSLLNQWQLELEQALENLKNWSSST